MSEKLINIIDLSVGYKGTPIIRDINLSLRKGDVMSLLGANGIGKSTLLKTITGELPIISGQVLINSKDITTYTKRSLATTIAIVTTERISVGGLRVHELVSLGRQPHTGFFGRLTDQDKAIIDNAIDVVGIKHKTNAFVAELSDGERQKAMIARAIAQDTPIIILDEPFSFLDTASRIDILNLLKQISREKNTGILLSSHDVSQALRMSDRICLVDQDRQLHIGSPQEIITSDAISKLFANEGVIFDKTQSDFISKI